jgi:hypothetical protein
MDNVRCGPVPSVSRSPNSNGLLYRLVSASDFIVEKVRVRLRFHPVAGHTDPEGE